MGRRSTTNDLNQEASKRPTSTDTEVSVAAQQAAAAEPADTKKEQKNIWRRILDFLCTVLSLRIALVIIYTVLVVLLCCIQAISLFGSPKISIMNIQASQIVGAQVPALSDTWYAVDIPIYGANASAKLDIHMWATTLTLDIEIPYDFAPQNITQQYRIQDIPCKAFRDTVKNMQIFSLLSIFTGFIVLVLAASNFFTRIFLPVLWFFVWLQVAFTASMSGMMFRMLCDGFCYGEPTHIPPFTSLAMPEGGFALALICFEAYLITSLMTVFL